MIPPPRDFGGGVLDLVDAGVRRAQRNPLDYVHLTPAQEDYERIDAPEAAWVDGNALGKSFTAAWSILHRMRGTHPWKRTRPPITGLVLGYSWDQMLPLQEKLWALVPKDEVDPRCGFEEGRGLTGKPPRLVLSSGPGAGSRLVLSTYRSGSRRIAGGQYDFVDGDEPMEGTVLGEIRPRLLRRRGMLRIGMTPTPDMPDISAIKRLIEKGRMVRHTVGLTEANCWPKGYPAPWHYQREIDEYAAGLLPHEVAMRIRGDWTPVVTDYLIRAYDERVHDVSVSLADLAGWELWVGIDHGTSEWKQCAVLLAARNGRTDRPEVVWLDESVAEDGGTTSEEDAQAIVDMLRRNGLTVRDVDGWVGDVPVSTHRGGVRKSNARLRKEIARAIGVDHRTLRPIDVPEKYPGSMWQGARAMNTLFRRRTADGGPVARIRKGYCERFRKSLRLFNGDPDHPAKDVWDAGRYPMERAIGRSALGALVARY